MYRYLLLFILLIGLQAVWAQEIMKFAFDESNFTKTATESVSGESFPIANHFERPERITGVSGNALRLDGYSTWVYQDNYTFSDISKKLLVETWFTTESFTKEKAGILSQIDDNSEKTK